MKPEYIKEQSTFLYKDKDFKNPFTIEDLEDVNKETRLRYAIDGNNGDKWIIVNWLYDYVYDEEGNLVYATNGKIQKQVKTVLGINISQNHMPYHMSRGFLNNFYKNGNEMFENMKMPENALELVKIIRNVQFLSW